MKTARPVNRLFVVILILLTSFVSQSITVNHVCSSLPFHYHDTLCYYCFALLSVDDVSNKHVREMTHFYPKTPFVLVGTKSDLREDGKADCVSSDEGEAKANQIGAACYIECSALKNENVKEVFEAAVRASLTTNDNDTEGEKSGDKKEGKCMLQ